MKQNFIFGASTAAHQVEGYNTGSDFWILENIPHSMYIDKSGAAVDHYHRYREDLELLKAAGMNAYRFSIEWARIEPEEGRYDEDALRHYKEVFEACRELDIQPIVTLHHFSSPAWLIRKGGWKNESTTDAFARYSAMIADYYRDYLSYICTINEANMGLQIQKISEMFMETMQNSRQPEAGAAEGPQVGLNNDATMQDMMLGMQEAAEAFGREDVNTYLSGRTLEEEKLVMRAHQAARDAIRAVNPDVKIGLTLSLFDIQAAPGGEAKAEELWYEDFGFYFPYLQEDDFIGVQNYTRKVINEKGEVIVPEGVKLTDAGYEYYPQSIGNVVKRVAGLWDKEIIVTENGISTADDSLRCSFIQTALEGILSCIESGIRITGYCHWSLLDNFEWQLGYAQRFGLIEVNRETMERIPKPSLGLYGKECRTILKQLEMNKE